MTAGSVAAPVYRERRIERARNSIELMLDRAFRPGDWAARLMYRLGLQGRLRATTTVVRTAAASPRSSPLRIAFASDFHAGPTTDDRLLARACMALHHLEPDVLLLGGDFVSVRASDISRLARHLAAIRAPHGKFAVLGNHDLRSNFSEVVRALTDAGVQLLSNSRTTLSGTFSDVSICGLDDPTRGYPRGDLALDGATGTRIVLMHSPQGLAALGDRPFDLALCGHTHGGQIVLPFRGPLWIPGEGLNRQYASGRFSLDPDGSRTLLVSRGIGCSTIPVRTFAAPEVHLCLIV